MVITQFILGLILILCVFYVHFSNTEFFAGNYQMYQMFNSLPYFPPYPLNPQFASTGNYTTMPWNNTMIGNTTNMSYDLRGDPLVIPKENFVWLNGTVFPIHNSPI